MISNSGKSQNNQSQQKNGHIPKTIMDIIRSTSDKEILDLSKIMEKSYKEVMDFLKDIASIRNDSYSSKPQRSFYFVNFDENITLQLNAIITRATQMGFFSRRNEKLALLGSFVFIASFYISHYDIRALPFCFFRMIVCNSDEIIAVAKCYINNVSNAQNPSAKEAVTSLLDDTSILEHRHNNSADSLFFSMNWLVAQINLSEQTNLSIYEAHNLYRDICNLFQNLVYKIEQINDSGICIIDIHVEKPLSGCSIAMCDATDCLLSDLLLLLYTTDEMSFSDFLQLLYAPDKTSTLNLKSIFSTHLNFYSELYTSSQELIEKILYTQIGKGDVRFLENPEFRDLQNLADDIMNDVIEEYESDESSFYILYDYFDSRGKCIEDTIYRFLKEKSIDKYSRNLLSKIVSAKYQRFIFSTQISIDSSVFLCDYELDDVLGFFDHQYYYFFSLKDPYTSAWFSEVVNANDFVKYCIHFYTKHYILYRIHNEQSTGELRKLLTTVEKRLSEIL